MPPRAKPRPTFVLVESNTTGTGRLFARAAAVDHTPVMLAADPARYPWLADEQVATHVVDTQDPAAVLAAARAAAGATRLAGVTSSSDYFIATAARTAAALGLAGPDPDAIEACRQKRLQRENLSRAGVACPWFAVARTPAEAAAHARGRVVVVKPVWGSGSIGVLRCDDPASAEAHAARLLAQKTNERGVPVPQEVLVEELVHGPEFSVETIGRTVVGVTQKHLGAEPLFVEIGHDFPAPLPPKQATALARTTLAALDALGLGWGPAHTELRVGPDGPVVIEVNPRLAGGFIPELVRHAKGIDLVTEVVRAAAGHAPRLRARHARAASIRFLLPPHAGVVAGRRGLPAAQAVRGVKDARFYVAIGDRARLAGDFRDRVGHVIAVAPTAADSARRATQALAALSLVVRPEGP